MKKAMVLVVVLVMALITLQLYGVDSADAVDLASRTWTTQAEEESSSADTPIVPGLTEFRATPARMRGRIDLSWKYAGRSFSGNFLVERSTNGGSWRSVTGCAQSHDDESDTYSCVDSNLKNGTSYAYRICIVNKGSACTAASSTKPVTVKAP